MFGTTFRKIRGLQKKCNHPHVHAAHPDSSKRNRKCLLFVMRGVSFCPPCCDAWSFKSPVVKRGIGLMSAAACEVPAYPLRWRRKALCPTAAWVDSDWFSRGSGGHPRALVGAQWNHSFLEKEQWNQETPEFQGLWPRQRIAEL